MNDTVTPTRPALIFFLVLFVFATIALGYLAARQRDDFVTLTINNEWQIYLMGVNQVDTVKFHVGRFTETHRNSRHLWLRGEGEIHWLKNVIRVDKAGVYFNNSLFTRARHEQPRDILFMRNGKAREGRPGQHRLQ